MNSLILFLSVLLFTHTCYNTDDDVICTEIFAAVTVEVTGVTLDDSYTVRVSTNDTIKHESIFGEGISTVLDDNYQSKLKNDQDEFLFVGIIADKIVVSEKYIIAADECHISKISGKDVVNLQND